MINFSKKRIFVLLFIFLACGCNRQEKIRNLLKSDNKTDIIKGCNLIQGPSDSLFVADLLARPYETGTSHNLRYKGITVYKVKILALERISTITAPHEINWKLDSLNIQFYLTWAKDRNLL